MWLFLFCFCWVFCYCFRSQCCSQFPLKYFGCWYLVTKMLIFRSTVIYKKQKLFFPFISKINVYIYPNKTVPFHLCLLLTPNPRWKKYSNPISSKSELFNVASHFIYCKIASKEKTENRIFWNMFQDWKKIENSSRPFSEIKIPNRTSTITQTKNLNWRYFIHGDHYFLELKFLVFYRFFTLLFSPGLY